MSLLYNQMFRFMCFVDLLFFVNEVLRKSNGFETKLLNCDLHHLLVIMTLNEVSTL